MVIFAAAPPVSEAADSNDLPTINSEQLITSPANSNFTDRNFIQRAMAAPFRQCDRISTVVEIQTNPAVTLITYK